jgi:hypothetical protein
MQQIRIEKIEEYIVIPGRAKKTKSEGDKGVRSGLLE